MVLLKKKKKSSDVGYQKEQMNPEKRTFDIISVIVCKLDEIT